MSDALPVAPAVAPYGLSIDRDGICDGVVCTRPMSERVKFAFSKSPPDEMEAKAIRAVLDNPGARISQLSALCGWHSLAWHRHMLAACIRRRHELWPEGVHKDASSAYWLSALVSYDPPSMRVWLHDDIADVFETLVECRTSHAAHAVNGD